METITTKPIKFNIPYFFIRTIFLFSRRNNFKLSKKLYKK